MSRGTQKERFKMKKELKKRLSATRILMIIFAVLSIITLFTNFAVCSVFAVAFHFFRLKAKDFEHRIKCLIELDRLLERFEL